MALDDKLDQLQRYLPRHLADKILANRGRLAGERKLVTVLFTDVTGYTALSEQLGEEALFALMDKVYELFIHEVHRYEGTVNEITGDGIVALFGAPLAVEQAPLRAVYTALALQREVGRFSARLEQEHGIRLQIRVGINTGPVIIGTVGNNLRMDYKAIGDTVNLAARMEQTAAPGTIQITSQTYRQVAGYVQCDDLGLASVKGKAAKVRVYRVTGERGTLSRLDVAREHGLTRLVGREQELHLLCEGFARVKDGYGQAMSIIGEAGLGKSRLLYEFLQGPLPTKSLPSWRDAVAPMEQRWPISRSLNYSNKTFELPRMTATPISEAKFSVVPRRWVPMSRPPCPISYPSWPSRHRATHQWRCRRRLPSAGPLRCCRC